MIDKILTSMLVAIAIIIWLGVVATFFEVGMMISALG